MQKTFKELLRQQLPFLIGVPALVWQVLFFYVPLIFIAYLSITLHPVPAGAFSYTLMHYATLLQWPYIKIIIQTIALALATATICLLIGYPLAYFIAFRAGRLKTFFLFLLIVPFWTNFLLHVYAWFYVLERNGFLNMVLLKLGLISTPYIFLNSLGAIVLVMVYCYLPFMVLPLYSVLDKFDTRLLEASADLGAYDSQTFMRVTLPLTLPGVITGFFLVFVPAFGEFAIPALLGGDRYMFAGSLITYLFLEGKDHPLGAAFVILSSLSIILGAFMVQRYAKKILALKD